MAAAAPPGGAPVPAEIKILPAPSAHHKTSGIQERYQRKWGLMHLLRELVTNWFDESQKIALREHKVSTQHIIVRAGPDVVHGLADGDFDLFIRVPEAGCCTAAIGRPVPTRDLVISTIRYTSANQLELVNPGSIPDSAFLYGGSSNFDLTDEGRASAGIAGAHGEGMKLAMLTGCRLRKPVTVYTSTRVVTAHLFQEPYFQSAVMHWDFRLERDLEPGSSTRVKVVIDNISLAEWIGTTENNTGVHTFLRLMEALAVTDPKYATADPHAVCAYDWRLGQLLLAPRFAGKIFNDGIYIDTLANKGLDFQLGYHVRGQETNRDRDVLINVNSRRTATSFLVADILEHADEIKAVNHSLSTGWAGLLRLLQDRLAKNAEEIWHLHLYCRSVAPDRNTKVADMLFSFWRAENRGLSEKFPVCPNTAMTNTTRFHKERLSPCVFPMHLVSWLQFNVFVHAVSYVTLDKRLATLKAGPDILLTAAQTALIGLARRCVKRSHPVQSQCKVVVKQDMKFNESFAQGDILYLSSRLFDEATVRRMIPEIARGSEVILSVLVATMCERELPADARMAILLAHLPGGVSLLAVPA